MASEREPRRVPKTPAATPAERAGAGCFGLLVFPFFISTLFGTFVSSVALPLEGPAGVIGGFVNLLLVLPFALILGSVAMTAFARATGSDQPVRMIHGASAGIAVSAIVMFVLATIASLFTGGSGLLPMFVLAGIIAIVAAVASFARRQRKREPARKRRRHARPPKPPWAHPLARTEKVNMYAEALVDEYNIAAVLAAAALSLLLGNPIPMLTAGGLELIYLAWVPDTQWFRRRVDRKHLDIAHDQAANRREEQLEFLASDQLERHEEMLRQVERTTEALEASDFPFEPGKLQKAVDHHLWLMQLENYYGDLDTEGRLRELDKRIRAAETDLEGVDEGRMRDVLDKRVEVLRRRRSQIEEMAERAREVADKRRILEETSKLIAESALAGSTSFDEIDEVLVDLQATEEVVLDLHDEEDELEAQIEEAYEAVAT